MTKKDYVPIAAILATADRSTTAQHAIQDITSQLADLFERDNPNFDRARFIAAASQNIKGY
jgi:hypothetical protein